MTNGNEEGTAATRGLTVIDGGGEGSLPDSGEARLEIEDHIATVQWMLERFVALLAERADTHDQSKLEEPEFSVFAAMPRRRSAIEYGSPEYEERLKAMAPALEHHYKMHRHHPQHFGDAGIAGMNLVDVIEMFADWASSSLDYGNGDLRDAIAKNKARFHFSDELESIFKNTVDLLAGGRIIQFDPDPEGEPAA